MISDATLSLRGSVMVWNWPVGTEAEASFSAAACTSATELPTNNVEENVATIFGSRDEIWSTKRSAASSDEDAFGSPAPGVRFPLGDGKKS